ncbi:MAG: hypothetical protein P4L40_21625 [Terracidiphilus sp.]|nr:hypothetical protein [Terracidiphilus sp.]
MDEPRTVPAQSAGADSPKQPQQLVDVPGLGPCEMFPTGDSSVAELRPVRPVRLVGADLRPGEVPEPLLSMVEGTATFQPQPLEAGDVDDSEQNRLIVKLLFAAKHLTEACRHAMPVIGQPIDLACDYCDARQPVLPRVEFRHERGCPVGGVEAAIENLFAYQQRCAAESVQSNPTGRERVTARAGNLNTAGPAGTPAQPKGLADRVCLKCGTRGGIWKSRLVSQAEFELSVLALNECASRYPTPSDMRIIYTHCCEGGAR